MFKKLAEKEKEYTDNLQCWETMLLCSTSTLICFLKACLIHVARIYRGKAMCCTKCWPFLPGKDNSHPVIGVIHCHGCRWGVKSYPSDTPHMSNGVAGVLVEASIKRSLGQNILLCPYTTFLMLHDIQSLLGFHIRKLEMVRRWKTFP